MTSRARKTRFHADQEELKLRTAWHYFIEGITQEQVAARLGISRVKAYRLLAATREDGTVQITINSKLEPLMRVQRELEKHLGLFEAVVVPVSESNEAAQNAVVGHATGLYLSQRLEPGQSIGLGWGATLQIAANALTWREVERLTLVSLLGGLTHASHRNPSSVAWRIAQFYQAELFQIAAPLFLPSADLARQLWALPEMGELRQRAASVDLALFSVSDLGRGASLVRQQLIDENSRQELIAAGAVADVLAHFLDADGALVDHPLNSRLMAINPADLRQVPKVVISSAGTRKAAAIRSGIIATSASALITDEATAAELLRLPPIPR